MYEEQKNVPVVGKNSDIIRAQCACFYVFFDTLLEREPEKEFFVEKQRYVVQRGSRVASGI